MKAVIALGNPGEKYENTRHNIGFMTADTLVEEKKGSWAHECDTQVFHTQFFGEKVLVIKPQTFMNNSGKAVKCLFNKYDLKATDCTIIYDDVDLPFSQIRVRQNGGSSGHKGVESIISDIDSQDFTRVRIGIDRPQDNTRVEEYVLQKFTEEEMKKVPEILENAKRKVTLLLKFSYEKFASKYNM